ncbi:MAG: TetR/AcrR family transcriptional regulator [Maritimibacter sp.]
MKHDPRQKQRIIASTLELIESGGMASASIASIAAAAGISRQTIYNHFPDVSAVIEAAVMAHIEAVNAHLGELIGGASDLDAKLVLLVAFMVDMAHPDHMMLPLDAALPAEARQRLDAAAEVPRQMLSDALVSETGRSDPALADLIWSMAETGAATAARYPDDKSITLSRLRAAIRVAITEGPAS